MGTNEIYIKETEQLIENLRKDESYRTIQILASDDFDLTQKVVGSDGETYIRKYIDINHDEHEGLIKLHEALRGASLPYIAKVIDSYVLPSKLVVISEYIEGVTLKDLVVANGPLSNDEIGEIFACLSASVGYLHHNNAGPIIHRDITPSNIIVSHKGNKTEAFLIDTGVARFYKPSKSRDTQYLGTIGYASPEQYGFGQSSTASDVYALGAVLYFCLTAEHPGNNLKTNIEEFDIRPELKKLIAKASSFDPENRHENASEFFKALDEALTGVEDRGISDWAETNHEEKKPPVAKEFEAGVTQELKVNPFVQTPPWNKIQRIQSIRYSWNAVLLFTFLLFSFAVYSQPDADFTLYDAHVAVFFIFMPTLLVSFDIFGAYKRISFLKEYKAYVILPILSFFFFILLVVAVMVLMVMQ